MIIAHLKLNWFSNQNALKLADKQLYFRKFPLKSARIRGRGEGEEKDVRASEKPEARGIKKWSSDFHEGIDALRIVAFNVLLHSRDIHEDVLAENTQPSLKLWGLRLLLQGMRYTSIYDLLDQTRYYISAMVSLYLCVLSHRRAKTSTAL